MKGLPYRGRCPECARGYTAREPSLPDAVSSFRATFPGYWRLWLSPTHDLRRASRGALVRVLVSTAIVSIAFVLAQFLVVLVVFTGPWAKLPTGDKPITTLFGDVGWFGPRLSLAGPQCWLAAASAFFGLLALEFGVFVWYGVAALRLKRHRRAMRRIGVCAAGSAPVAVLVPMGVVVLWQFLNVCRPASWGFVHLGTWLQRLGRYQTDWEHVVSLLALAAVAGVVGVRFYRRHRMCIQRVHDALAGVRHTHQDDDSPAR